MVAFGKRAFGVALVVLATVAPVQSGQQVTFRYQFSESNGAIYRTESVMKQNQTLNINGIEQTLENEMVNREVSVFTLMEKTEDGNFKVQKENKQLYASVNISALGKYVFDSESGEQDKGSFLSEGLNPLYSSLHKAYLFPVISPQGKVVKLTGYNELIKEAIKNPIAAQFAGGGSDEVAALGISQTFPEFPEKPLAVGDEWEVPFEIGLQSIGTLKGNRKFKFEELETNGKQTLAKISFTDELTGKIDTKVDQATVTGTVSISNGGGTFWFDVDKGRLVKLEGKYTTNGDLTVSALGQNIPITQKDTTSVTVELLEKLPE